MWTSKRSFPPFHQIYGRALRNCRALPARYAFMHSLSRKLRFCVLEGGLDPRRKLASTGALPVLCDIGGRSTAVPYLGH